MKLDNKQELFIKKLAREYKLDYRICKEIVNSPFAYLKYLVTSDSIEEGLRIPYFGAFTQKGEYKNKTMRTETRKKQLLDEIEKVAPMMAATLGFPIKDINSARTIIENAWEEGDYEKINMIWKGWVEYEGHDESI